MSVKGTNYSENEIRALLLGWADQEVQNDLNGLTRNKPIFEKLADQLVEAGYPRRTGQACRDKINRIKASYRVIRDEGRKSGHGAQDEPFWFEIIDGVLGTKPATCPIASFDSGNTQPIPGSPPGSPEHSIDVNEDMDADQNCAQASDSGSDIHVVAQGSDIEVALQDETQDLDESTADMLEPNLGTTPDEDTTDGLDTSLEGLKDKKDQKGKKKVLKRKAPDTKTKLVAALQSSQNEVQDQMQRMEKRQCQADREEVKRQKEQRDRDWERRMEVEERRRSEDLEMARNDRREARDFNMALMAMMERQTNVLASMMGNMQYGHHPAPYQPHPAPFQYQPPLAPQAPPQAPQAPPQAPQAPPQAPPLPQFHPRPLEEREFANL